MLIARQVSRSGSPGTRSNDRLQDRLAKALANKSATTNPRSRTRSPHANTSSPRGSLDTTRSDIGRSSISLSRETATDGSRDSTSFVKPTSSVEEVEVEVTEDPQGEIWGVSPRVSMEASAAQPLRTSTDCSRDTRTARNTGAAHGSKDRPSELSPADYEALISKLNGDIERSELERQNESRDYVEKIDGLQAKLQYLANESLHSAKSLANQAPADSLEVKIAAKEQQIALLMQEGQRLSKKEMVQTNMIKKLRAQAEEQSKAIKSAAERCEKAEGERELLSEHARQVLGIEKQLAEKTRQHSHLQKEADRLRLERDANQDTVLELKALLEEAIAADNEAENTNAIEALEKEKKLVVELNDEVARVKLEKELADDRARSKINELTAKIEILSEENRLSIMEAKAEHTLLEGRLEAMRARAEEVSSSATGDAQAKLLRQIETLQSQYSVASENWQGIETSLVARIAILEKERDELAKKEQDLRRKARENVSRPSEHHNDTDFNSR